jgi:hypothetical protein
MRTLTGKLTEVTYFDTSRNGNSRYTAHIDGHTVFTGVDSSLGYAIKNYEDKRVSLAVRMLRGKLTIEGRVEVLPAHPDTGYYRAQFAGIDTSTEYKATIQVRGPDGRATNHMNVTADQLRAIEAVMCDPVLAGR